MAVSSAPRLLPLAACAVALLLFTSCSTTVATDPSAYPFPSHEVFALTPGVSVSVANGQTEEKRVEVGSRVYCELRQFTATASEMVQRELAKKGASVAPGGRKTVVLRVTHPGWQRGMWSQTGRVTLEADLGDGQKLLYDAEYQTAGNAMRMFNGALLRVVTAFLKDPAVAAYLNAPDVPQS